MEVPAPEHDGASFLLGLLADGIRPDRRRPLSEWAEAERVLTEGAHEGRWRNHRAPYLVEIMDRLSMHCATNYVTIQGSAQIGKTQAPLNLLGQVLSETPVKALVVLPSINSLRMYNRDKLDPMIKASPVLASAVADVTERSAEASTTAVKRGARGAQVELVTASSSKDLQSRSTPLVILEELEEYERDVGGRGDPADQAENRTLAFRKSGRWKVVRVSTAGVKGQCRITRAWEEGSQGQFAVACPHCAHPQPLRFGQLTWPRGQPERAAYACESCGAVIDERDKKTMLARGAWVHAHPERLGHHASYRLNALYSPFTPWADIAREAEKVEAGTASAKNFAQQFLAEAYDAANDLPKADALLLRRDKWQPGRIPPEVVYLAGATDVQGNRLVWALWGFDRHFGQWLIDTGVLEGDPTLPGVWAEHDALLSRTWRDAWGKDRAADDWGIDSGYLSTQVYRYCRRWGVDRTPRVRALDGVAKWKQPALGQPREQRITWQGKAAGIVRVWPVGTWDIKAELASALRLTEEGPGPEGWPRGALRFNEQVDRGWIDELLAEHCVENPRTGERSWKKIAPRNEAWDCAVYARAIARHVTVKWTPERWDEECARRLGPPDQAQADMRDLWSGDSRAAVAEAVRKGPPPPPQRRAPIISSWMG